MKLHRLEIEGFGPFRSRQSVDFDAFEDDGIFLISGRTGSGKSSILDGVCFALFGSVPRYEASEKRIRSDHSTTDDATSVTLEFTAAGRRLRLERSPEYERPKARSAGMTTVPHAARIDEWCDGEWQTRAARPREVANLLDEIVGLNQQQFLQVILLAQGRFAQFLLAKNDERQALLRTLFGTRVYQDYQTAFEERRKRAAHALERGDDGLRMLLAEAHLLIEEHGLGGETGPREATDVPPASPAGEISDVERAVERAQYRADTLTRQAGAAEDAHAAAAVELTTMTALRARQVDRARSRAALEALENAEPAAVADRAELARAIAAEILRAPIEASRRAQAEADTATQAEHAALAAWAADGESGDGDLTTAPDSAALRTLIDELTGALTLWQSAADQEPELRSALSRVAAGRLAVEEGAAALAQLDAQLDAIPGRRAVIGDELATLEGAALALETARAQESSLETRLRSARDAAQKAETVRDVEQQHAERLDALERATGEVATLLRLRLAGYAGELAQSLVEGDACAVCGSIEHPQPAEHAAEPVTAEMIADAEERKSSAAAVEQTAASAARTARAEHAAAAARAGGATPAELEAELAAASVATEQAVITARRREELIATRDELIELEALVRGEHEALRAHVVTARESVAADEQRAHDLQETVDAARGDFATVAERIAAVTRRRRQARDLADKSETRAVRDAAARDADSDRDGRVAASDFADVGEALSALRDDSAREDLTARIRRHEISLATEKDRLRELELELAGEPDELIELDPIHASVAIARALWRDAEASAAGSVHAAVQLASLAERLRLANAATAHLTATHELVAGLANAVAGRTASRMDLETFVLAAELEEIVTAANLRLDEMSSGRYHLQHSDAVAVRNGASGLGLEVLDAYTGRARPPQSLSGGETFLASLALALGLAEVVTARAGGIRLDTLFVDEGFGSLDAETLDLAMRTLDELRQGGRTVGVISHVEAMKEQLPAQLVVESTPAGPSVIRQEVALAV